MTESNDMTESEELFNQEIEAILEEIKETYHDKSINESEKNGQITQLLREMEEYTQPLIDEIDNLNGNQKDAILYRISRLFPEIMQKEIKSVSKYTANHESIQPTILYFESSEDKTSDDIQDLNKILTRLGYQDLDQLFKYIPLTILYDNIQSGFIKREQSETTTSNKIEKQLNEWKKQKEENQIKTMKKIKEMKINNQDKDESKPNKNNAKKVMMMMGVDNFENADDVTAICNASTKALRKLV